MTNPFPYPQPSTAPAPGMEALLEPVAGVALAGDCREPGRLLAEVGRGQAEVPRGFWFNGRVELKHMFGVDKGDTVKLSVKAYYENDPATDAMLSAAEMLAQILMGAEGGPAAGEGASVSNSTLDESAVAAMNANKSASAQEDVPKAFLNYMFFDEDMTFVTSGFVQITGAAKNLWENVAFANPIVIEENGYFLTYVSNETNAASVVDFDDLTVTHSKTPIVQVDDYYPFGLTFNSFTRSYSTPQRYKYNGKEEQDDWGVGVLDYGARMYMADIGRWGVVDPMSEMYLSLSPYHYVRNNPISLYDVNGMYDQSLLDQWEQEDLEENGHVKTNYSTKETKESIGDCGTPKNPCDQDRPKDDNPHIKFIMGLFGKVKEGDEKAEVFLDNLMDGQDVLEVGEFLLQKQIVPIKLGNKIATAKIVYSIYSGNYKEGAIEGSKMLIARAIGRGGGSVVLGAEVFVKIGTYQAEKIATDNVNRANQIIDAASKLKYDNPELYRRLMDRAKTLKTQSEWNE